MAAADNCLIARTNLAAGTEVLIDDQLVVLPQHIELGHTLARCALQPGDKVLRYGAIIGSVTVPIAMGAHIHTHNLESDYIQTFTLDQDGHHFLGKDAS